ncbi:MAG: hypothetical protein HYY58_00375 [Candidatus Omnitrophica bacterium]|nr:hypothetical protein [Candidatus Omnitrophota bacterium]
MDYGLNQQVQHVQFTPCFSAIRLRGFARFAAGRFTLLRRVAMLHLLLRCAQ